MVEPHELGVSRGCEVHVVAVFASVRILLGQGCLGSHGVLAPIKAHDIALLPVSGCKSTKAGTWNIRLCDGQCQKRLLKTKSKPDRPYVTYLFDKNQRIMV